MLDDPDDITDADDNPIWLIGSASEYSDPTQLSAWCQWCRVGWDMFEFLFHAVCGDSTLDKLISLDDGCRVLICALCDMCRTE